MIERSPQIVQEGQKFTSYIVNSCGVEMSVSNTPSSMRKSVQTESKLFTIPDDAIVGEMDFLVPETNRHFSLFSGLIGLGNIFDELNQNPKLEKPDYLCGDTHGQLAKLLKNKLGFEIGRYADEDADYPEQEDDYYVFGKTSVVEEQLRKIYEDITPEQLNAYKRHIGDNGFNALCDDEAQLISLGYDNYQPQRSLGDLSSHIYDQMNKSVKVRLPQATIEVVSATGAVTAFQMGYYGLGLTSILAGVALLDQHRKLVERRAKREVERRISS